MFRIRVFTPEVVSDTGWPHAGAELVAGTARRQFRIDLRYWRIIDYQRQWAAGIARLADGAPSSALMSTFAGYGSAPQSMWALWRENEHVWVQPHCVLPAELEAPFDPRAPYAHVGWRVPVTEQALPLVEWRVRVGDVIAAKLGIRWPMSQ